MRQSLGELQLESSQLSLIGLWTALSSPRNNVYTRTELHNRGSSFEPRWPEFLLGLKHTDMVDCLHGQLYFQLLQRSS